MHASRDPGNLRILYPADGTVFPRGMLSPDLMCGGQAAVDAVYLSIRSTAFTYSGCLLPAKEGYLHIPQDIWAQASARTGGGEELPLQCIAGFCALVLPPD